MDNPFKWPNSKIRNPLGVIGLFITLVYGVAGAVLGVSASELLWWERIPLILFIVLFPILILGVFTYLVIKHHKKLYGPGDFKDEKNFMKTDVESQRKRMNEATDIIEEETPVTTTTTTTVVEDDPVNRKNQLKGNYFVAKELAIRAIEIDQQISVKREIAFLGKKNLRYLLDGFAQKKNSVYGIEIRFTSVSHLSKRIKEKIEFFVEKYNAGFFEQPESIEFLPIVIVVTTTSETVQLELELENLNKLYQNRVRFIVYRFEDLQNRFGFR